MEKSCVACGFGDELEVLQEVTGPDGKKWWAHEVCLEVKENAS